MAQLLTEYVFEHLSRLTPSHSPRSSRSLELFNFASATLFHGSKFLIPHVQDI